MRRRSDSMPKTLPCRITIIFGSSIVLPPAASPPPPAASCDNDHAEFPSSFFVPHSAFCIPHYMKVPVKMPQLGESIAEAKIVAFLVQPGDSVTADQNVIE